MTPSAAAPGTCGCALRMLSVQTEVFAAEGREKLHFKHGSCSMMTDQIKRELCRLASGLAQKCNPGPLPMNRDNPLVCRKLNPQCLSDKGLG